MTQDDEIASGPTPPFNRARVIEVVQTTLTRRGSGKDPGEPVRVVTQYWSKDGRFLAEHDPFDEIRAHQAGAP